MMIHTGGDKWRRLFVEWVQLDRGEPIFIPS